MSLSSKIILVAVLASTFFVISCNNNKNNSPFGEILSQPPYTDITDSIKKEPQNDELYFRRAVLLNRNNFPEPALADFQKAWSLKKEEKYALGVSTILIDKKPDSAIAFLNQALNEIPNSFLLYLSLARSYNAQNKTDDALKICNEILQANPEQVDVLKMKAELLDKKGNKDESINILEKAYHLTPFDVDLNYMLALKYAESKNPKVVILCDSLIKKDSLHLHAEPYYYKGIYFSNTSDKTKALAMFNEAIQHDYYFLDAYIEKGAVLYEQKKYNEALKVFQLVHTISATFADAYYWIGKCQQALGQKDEALLNYQRAYGLDKTFTQAKDSAERIRNKN
jgi:tetratricopeptide (TPR) repeat protein